MTIFEGLKARLATIKNIGIKFCLTKKSEEKEINKMENKYTRSIILDPAHGHNTPGKCSPDRTHYEWEWSRQILYKVKENLEKIGVTVYMSNNTPTEYGLLDRVNHMNAIAAPAFVFSLHNNAAGMGTEWMSARGASIWTTRGVTKSDAYATQIFEKLQKDIPEAGKWRTDYWSDQDPDWESNFTVLMSKHPSVLLEFLFQDNKEDLALIKDESIKSKLVQSLTEVLTEISQL